MGAGEGRTGRVEREEYHLLKKDLGFMSAAFMRTTEVSLKGGIGAALARYGAADG